MKEQRHSKIALYSGLSVLALAFISKWMQMPVYSFWILLCIGIAIKTIFLISIIRSGLKPNKGFYIILIGVGMILISMVFKYIYPILLLSKILFFSAILLKITGLILMMIINKKQ